MSEGRAVRVDLEADVLTAIGALGGTAGGPLSPWPRDAAGVEERARERARALVEGPSGRSLAAALAAIATATARTSVRVTNSDGGVESAFYTSDAHAPVSMLDLAQDGKVRLEDPAPGSELTEFVEIYVGRSARKSRTVSLDLGVDEAHVLAALVDVQRRKRMADIAAGRTTPSPVRIDELQAELALPDRGTFWLLDAVRRQCASEFTAASVDAALTELAGRGLVETTPGAVRLAGPADGLDRQFLVVGTAVELENLRADGNGELKKVGFTCLQSGVNDLLTVECLQTGAHIETISAEDLLAYVAHFVGAEPPSPRTDSAPAPTPAPTVVRPSFCTICGARVARDERFCTSCGTPVAEMATR